MKSLFGLRVVGMILLVCLIIGSVIGWGMNIFKLTSCDFEKPYKAEVIRVIGVPFAPVGIIAGYMDLGK